LDDYVPENDEYGPLMSLYDYYSCDYEENYSDETDSDVIVEEQLLINHKFDFF